MPTRAALHQSGDCAAAMVDDAVHRRAMRHRIGAISVWREKLKSAEPVKRRG